ncbi:Benzyl alcohol O-benzoyltransferase [Hibiscus syriacus]|uniref:Benzyl alcohol O-benzoyltransferase n=1 Tax=Hibiscus syriacus TaxID=106335 RepID=A0A6A3AVR8_HIBSY|nr:benzyl alcohol O-benzoyltransferase-like [Hibiscus syriacus]KAE8707873.1 Benzyl alcohol O-benzoyltransferase [Hibiscus syriacus]
MATPSVVPLTFTVRRCEPELVAPAKPTPREQKPLSDIDDQASLRFQIPFIHIYRHHPSMEGKDPADVIKAALAQTLVLYYPFAGRLREGANGKLIVDCNGEGVMFIKAEADVTLQQFGDELRPPFPCFDQLLFDVPGSEGMINCPLLLIQVTRLRCGGFIYATRLNHVMTDGPGIKQFMSAVAAMARGQPSHLIPPVWERHLLDAPHPPQVTLKHHEYDEVELSTATPWPSDNLVDRSFFFGHTEVSLLRSLLPPHVRRCTKFELLTAFLWRCRTLAINIDPDEEVRMMSIINARFKFNPPILPPGYYGNGFLFPAAITTVKKLRENPLGYAVGLVQQAKASLTEEYMKSVAALMVNGGKQLVFPNVMGSFIISDLTRASLDELDFGWGKAAFAGNAKAVGVISFLTPTKSKKGEARTLVSICLPGQAMERFAEEVDNMLKQQPIDDTKSKPKLISSAL